MTLSEALGAMAVIMLSLLLFTYIDKVLAL